MSHHGSLIPKNCFLLVVFLDYALGNQRQVSFSKIMTRLDRHWYEKCKFIDF